MLYSGRCNLPVDIKASCLSIERGGSTLKVMSGATLHTSTLDHATAKQASCSINLLSHSPLDVQCDAALLLKAQSVKDSPVLKPVASANASSPVLPVVFRKLAHAVDPDIPVETFR
jgi:hypothetical protein